MLGNSPIDVRTAQPADIPRLAAVQLGSALTAFADIFPESVAKPQSAELEAEWMAMADDPASTVLLAEVGGTIVAGVAFGDVPVLAPAGHGLLAKLYVLPDHFGCGIGTVLYDSAIEHLRAAAWERAWLWVLEGNIAARGMYERRGWLPQPERRTDWPGSGVFEMAYALDLAPLPV